jgi:hypothetical protein
MFDDVHLRDEASGSSISTAYCAYRNKKTQLDWVVYNPQAWELWCASANSWCFAFLRAQCSENMSCLSSERKKRKISPPPLTVPQIGAQRSTVTEHLVSKFETV